jgi:hypothetical protein
MYGHEVFDVLTKATAMEDGGGEGAGRSIAT